MKLLQKFDTTFLRHSVCASNSEQDVQCGSQWPWQQLIYHHIWLCIHSCCMSQVG